LAKRLDALQATNASKFGDINDSLQRLDANMLANDNHLFTTQAHQQAIDKNLAILKRDIDKRFDGIEDSHTRLKARIGDSHATLNERIEDSHARLEASIGDSHTTLNERIEDLSATMKKFMSCFDNLARQRHCSRLRSSRSSFCSNHVDDHVRLQQPRPPPHKEPQHDAPRRLNQERQLADHPPQGQAHQGDPHIVNQDQPQAEHPTQGQAHCDVQSILNQE
jgi:chromosome segregation ATPase